MSARFDMLQEVHTAECDRGSGPNELDMDSWRSQSRAGALGAKIADDELVHEFFSCLTPVVLSVWKGCFACSNISWQIALVR